MPSRAPSKQRLEELVALARTYRGWSTRELARELGRDVHHLVPDSGVPKLDIVIALADALDWTVQDVVDDLCGNVPSVTKGHTEKAESPDEPETFAKLNRAAWDAWQSGDYQRTVLTAHRAYRAASTGNERAIACLREFSGWDCLGRYQLALDAVQRGLAAGPTEDDVAGPLRNDLAYCHYILGQLEEAVGVATALLAELESGEWNGLGIGSSQGVARFVRGAAVRAQLVAGVALRPSRIVSAVADLEAASDLLDEAADRFGAPSYAGIALTARGARVTLQALTGDLSVADAIDTVINEAGKIVDPAAGIDKHLLEGVGWWCVFGGELASARIQSDTDRERSLGILTNKVDEISRVIGNWALRERVWRLEVLRRIELAGDSDEPWVIDRADARELTGAMARFPKFRSIGWQVFRAAEIGDGV